MAFLYVMCVLGLLDIYARAFAALIMRSVCFRYVVIIAPSYDPNDKFHTEGSFFTLLGYLYDVRVLCSPSLSRISRFASCR